MSRLGPEDPFRFLQIPLKAPLDLFKMLWAIRKNPSPPIFIVKYACETKLSSDILILFDAGLFVSC